MTIYNVNSHAHDEHSHNCGCGSHSTTTSQPSQLSIDINIDMSTTPTISSNISHHVHGHDCGCEHSHDSRDSTTSTESVTKVLSPRKTDTIYTNQCKQCGNEFKTLNKNTKLCSDECRNERDKGRVMFDSTCTVCESNFKSYKAGKQYCSQKCYSTYRRREETKLFGDREGIDYIVCPICNVKLKQISHVHAQTHGYASPLAMKDALGIEPTCQSKRDKHAGENNPAYNHGGKYSPWSKNFVNGYDEERHLAHNKKLSDLMNDPEYRKNFPFFLEYWLVVAEGNEEVAKQLYTKSQTRDLDWFIEKHGPEDGPIRHRHKIEEWMKNFKKVNYSMVSQVLFDEIMDRLPDEYKTQVFYATHNLSPDAAPGTNNEYRLSTVKSFVRPDFIMLDKKKVIEFDGTYWHSPERYDPEKEEHRDADIQEMGYDILHIAEYDFKHYRDAVIQKCVDFIMKTL